MKRKIFRSMLFTMIMMSFISIVLLVGVLYQQMTSTMTSQLQGATAFVQQIVNEQGLPGLKQLEKVPYRITYIQKDGTVLFDSVSNIKMMENHLDRKEVQDAMENGSGMAIRQSNTVGQKTLYYAYQLDNKNVIRLAMQYDSIGALVVRLISVIGLILLIALGLTSFLANQLSYRIVKRMNEIDLDHPLEENIYPELSGFMLKIARQNEEIQSKLEQIHQKKKEFEAVIQGMQDGLILLNRQGEILSLNDVAKKQLNLQQDIVGKPFSHACQHYDLIELVHHAMHGEKQEILMDQQGQKIRVLATPIFSHQILVGISVSFMDVTLQMENEEQRRQFTANASHELKTPLQTIMASSELLKNHLVKAEDEQRFISKIYDESVHLLALINDIMDLNQLEETKKVPEMIRVNEVIEKAIKTLQPALQQKNLVLHQDIESLYALSVESYIYDIAYNLLDNAIAYSHQDGEIALTLKRKNEHMILTIQDHGIGIPKQDQQRIFERFYRVDASRSSKGTGLGLAIVKHAVQRLYGKVHVESQLGQGSTFTVELPFVERA